MTMYHTHTHMNLRISEINDSKDTRLGRKTLELVCYKITCEVE